MMGHITKTAAKVHSCGVALALACLLLCAAPASAQAPWLVWYEMVSGDGVVISSGSGQRLVIETDANPGPHDFVILMRADFIPAGFGNLSWSLDLLEFEGVASVTSVNYLGPYDINDPVFVGGHPVILNAGQFQLFGPPVQGGKLLEFDLRFNAPGGTGVTEVSSGIGSGGWSWPHIVQFGDATPLHGANIGAISDAPSIEIHRIPEPESALLFVVVILASLALAPRRFRFLSQI